LDAGDQRALDKRMIELDGHGNEVAIGCECDLGSFHGGGTRAAAAQKLPLYKYLANYSTVRSANLLPVPMMNF